MRNVPRCIEHIGLRRAINAEIQSDRTLYVHHVELIGVAQLCQPLSGLDRLVFVIEPINRHSLLGKGQQIRMLHAAGVAPGCPYIHQRGSLRER